MKEIEFTKWEDAPTLTEEERLRMACLFDEQGCMKRIGVQERWQINKEMLSDEKSRTIVINGV